MKWEWKKQEKTLYLPGRKPELVEVGTERYIAIDGEGNPNTEPYAQRIETLYGLTWSIRMMPKGGITPEGYFEYTVYPLEGVYQMTELWETGTLLNKEALTYTLMIRQPDFVTPEVLAMAATIAAKKKTLPCLSMARLEDQTDGLSVQMLHIGPYDDEPASFAQMDAFCEANGLVRVNDAHWEIYLGDPRKSLPENYRTVLRYSVRHA